MSQRRRACSRPTMRTLTTTFISKKPNRCWMRFHSTVLPPQSVARGGKRKSLARKSVFFLCGISSAVGILSASVRSCGICTTQKWRKDTHSASFRCPTGPKQTFGHTFCRNVLMLSRCILQRSVMWSCVTAFLCAWTSLLNPSQVKKWSG